MFALKSNVLQVEYIFVLNSSILLKSNYEGFPVSVRVFSTSQLECCQLTSLPVQTSDFMSISLSLPPLTLSFSINFPNPAGSASDMEL